MNKRIKKLWIKALRSGEFKQTTNALRDGAGRSTRYCCLGVLCELHRRHSEESGSWKRDGYLGNTALLPDEVQAWAKLDDGNPDVPGDNLAGLNDGGKDFCYIADAIEKYF